MHSKLFGILMSISLALLSIVPIQAAEEIPTNLNLGVFRLYNPNSGEHFYTNDSGENQSLVNVGWRYEGEAWQAPSTSSTPIYRLYNPNAGDHHYTTDLAEAQALARLGWKMKELSFISMIPMLFLFTAFIIPMHKRLVLITIPPIKRK